MRKKTIIYLTGFSLFIMIVGSIFWFVWDRNKEVPGQSGILIVNNETTITENVVIHLKENANYADLPLTEVLKNLGMTVDWVDDDTAEITYSDKKYALNLSEVSLVEFEQDFNLLLPPPEGNRSCKILDGELILDSNTIKSALYQMGEKINIDIDRNELVVYIVEKTN